MYNPRIIALSTYGGEEDIHHAFQSGVERGGEKVKIRRRFYTTRDGLPSNDVFSIREDHNFDLLIARRGGVSRMHEGRLISEEYYDMPAIRSILKQAAPD